MDKVVCVGKNYAEHASELGDAVPEKPVFFLKPPSVVVQVGLGRRQELPLPAQFGEIHHECEVVVRLGKGGFELSEAEADLCIEAVTLGLDMTLRDLQANLKKKGHPWTTAKVFPASAVVGPFVSTGDFHNWRETPFSLRVNQQPRQQGVMQSARFSPAACIAMVSQHFPLCPGDLLFTGTPKGVNSVVPGDVAELKWGDIHYSLLWQKK